MLVGLTSNGKNGEIDIKQSENCVEGMQPALEYYNQIKEFLKDLPDNAVYVLIGTRSDMSCIQNVVREQSPLIDMAYKCYDFSYTQTIIALEENNKLIEIDGFDLINTFDDENLF